MNGEISGKKIQNMDIMEVRKNKYLHIGFLQMVSTETKVVQGGVLEFAPLCDDQQICMAGIRMSH